MSPKLSHRPRPHWMSAALGTLFGVSVVGASIFTMALALGSFDAPLELDGNAADSSVLAGTDWNAEYTAGRLSGSGGAFIDDPILATADPIFTGGGSKDDNDVTGWKNTVGSVPDKDNINTAYARALTDTNGHQLIYFGADRFDDSGDAQMGFWFFQNEVKPSGGGFSGTHTDKDLLIQVGYDNGGAHAVIRILKWQSDGTGTYGSPKKVLKELGIGDGSGVVCNVSTPGEPAPAGSACVTTNTGDITVAWPYSSKTSNGATTATVPTHHFIEGVVDVTALVGNVCITSFMATTRSSGQTVTSQLKDFALGNLNTCSITVSKSCDASKKGYDSATDTFKTEHVITITNDGGGKVYDVQFQDNSVNNTTMCNIIKIGNGSAISVPISSATAWNNVVSELAGNNTSVDVRLLCLSEAGFANQVTVRASSAAGGTPIPANSDDTDTEDADNVAACAVDIEPAVDLTKDCKGLSLVQGNDGKLAAQVCATVTVSNPISSGQYLDVTEFKNYPGTGGVSGTGTSVLTSFTTANNALGQIPDPNDPTKKKYPGHSGAALPNDGVPVSFDICYTPSAADSGAGNQDGSLDPSKVKYSDTVQVKGTGRLGSKSVSDQDDAFCKLCPECPDCGS